MFGVFAPFSRSHNPQNLSHILNIRVQTRVLLYLRFTTKKSPSQPDIFPYRPSACLTSIREAPQRLPQQPSRLSENQTSHAPTVCIREKSRFCARAAASLCCAVGFETRTRRHRWDGIPSLRQSVVPAHSSAFESRCVPDIATPFGC